MSEIDLQDKIDDFLNSALKKFIVKNYNDAIRDLKAAEVLDKENPEILYNLGVNYCRLGLYKTAISYFQKVLDLSQTFVEIHTVKKLLSLSLIKCNRFEDSEKILDDVISLIPNDTVALNMKGFCLEVCGRNDSALEIYKSILEIDSKNYNACNSIAYILSKNNIDLIESLRYAEIAYNSNKNNPAYLDTIGYVYMKKGEFDAARKYLLKAIQISPFSKEIIQHVEELKGYTDKKV